jgi:hypothetical protein
VLETLKANYKRLMEQFTALKMTAKHFAEDLVNSEQFQGWIFNVFLINLLWTIKITQSQLRYNA